MGRTPWASVARSARSGTGRPQARLVGAAPLGRPHFAARIALQSATRPLHVLPGSAFPEGPTAVGGGPFGLPCPRCHHSTPSLPLVRWRPTGRPMEGGLVGGLLVGVGSGARLALWVAGLAAVASIGFCVYALADTWGGGTHHTHATPAESHATGVGSGVGASVPSGTARRSPGRSRAPHEPPTPTRARPSIPVSPSRVRDSPSRGQQSTTSSMSPSTSLDGSIDRSRFAGATSGGPMTPPFSEPHVSPPS